MIFSRFFASSLKARITFASLTIFMISFWGFALYDRSVVQRDLQSQLSEQQFVMASLLAAEVDSAVKLRISSLEAAAVKISKKMKEGPAALQADLEVRTGLMNLFNGGFFVTDAAGTAVASVPAAVGRVGVNYMYRDHVASALQAGQSKVSELVIGTQLKVPVFSFAVPIRDAQAGVMGALIGVIDLSKPSFLDQFTAAKFGKSAGYTLLVTPKQRLIVMSSDKRRAMTELMPLGAEALTEKFVNGYEGSGVTRNAMGVEVLVSAKSVPTTGWYALVGMPVEEAFAPVRDMERDRWVGGLLLSLLAGGLTWWMLRYQLAPLNSAAKAIHAQSLSSADQWQALTVVNQDEVGDLVDGFNRLMQTLVKREKALTESESRFRTAFVTAPDSININRLSDGLYIEVNDGFQVMTGWTRAEVIGRTSLDINIWRNTEDRQRIVELLKRDGRFQNFEAEFVAKDGRVTCCQMSAEIIEIGGETCILSVTRDITERKHLQEQLEESHEKYRGLSEAAFEAIFISEKGICLEQNTRAKEMFGYTDEEAIGQFGTQWIAPQDRDLVKKNMLAGYELPYEVMGLRKDGSTFPARILGKMMPHRNKPVRVTSMTDITAQKQAQEALRLTASVFTHAHEGISIADRNGLIVNVNEAFTRITGYSHEEVLGKNPRILQSGRHSKDFYTAMWTQLLDNGYWSGEIWNRRKSGDIYPEMLTISAVRDEHGQIQQYVALFADISERKRIEAQVHQLAFYDALTQLPNRRLLDDRLGQTMAASKRSELYCALIFLDLDNFKPLNDTHGHRVGDLLLVEVAHRLKNCVREMDTVARFGGDEFVVIVSELDKFKISSIQQAGAVAEKILRSLSAPYQLHVSQEGESFPKVVEHRCSASIGVTVFLSNDLDKEGALNQADAAMYQAKEAGRNLVRFFEDIKQV